MSRALAIVLLLLIAIEGAHAEDGIALAELMARMRQVTSVRATFVEERYLRFLTEPVRSEGVLIFERPSRLARHVTSPIKETSVIQDDRLVIESASGEKREIQISDAPVLAALIDAVRNTLAGDDKALAQAFFVESSVRGPTWELLLRSRSDLVREALDSVVIRGQVASISEIEIRTRNGERTVTRLTESR